MIKVFNTIVFILLFLGCTSQKEIKNRHKALENHVREVHDTIFVYLKDTTTAARTEVVKVVPVPVKQVTEVLSPVYDYGKDIDSIKAMQLVMLQTREEVLKLLREQNDESDRKWDAVHEIVYNTTGFRKEILRLVHEQGDHSNKKWKDAEKAILHTTTFMSNVPRFFYLTLLSLFLILLIIYRYLVARLKRKTSTSLANSTITA